MPPRRTRPPSTAPQSPPLESLSPNTLKPSSSGRSTINKPISSTSSTASTSTRSTRGRRRVKEESSEPEEEDSDSEEEESEEEIVQPKRRSTSTASRKVVAKPTSRASTTSSRSNGARSTRGSSKTPTVVQEEEESEQESQEEEEEVVKPRARASRAKYTRNSTASEVVTKSTRGKKVVLPPSPEMTPAPQEEGDVEGEEGEASEEEESEEKSEVEEEEVKPVKKGKSKRVSIVLPTPEPDLEEEEEEGEEATSEEEEEQPEQTTPKKRSSSKKQTPQKKRRVIDSDDDEQMQGSVEATPEVEAPPQVVDEEGEISQDEEKVEIAPPAAAQPQPQSIPPSPRSRQPTPTEHKPSPPTALTASALAAIARQAAIDHASIAAAREKELEGKPRLVIHQLVLENFKSYKGRGVIGPFHKVRSPSLFFPNELALTERGCTVLLIDCRT